MLEEMKISELMKLVSALNGNKTESKCFWEVGKSYFIRTVTMHLVGSIKDITEKEILLSSASWVADSGRFHDAMKTGVLNEIEPFVNDVIVNREAIVDATEWKLPLPKEQK